MNIQSSVQLGSSSKFLAKLDTGAIIEINTEPNAGFNHITVSDISVLQYETLNPIVYNSAEDVDLPILSAIENMRNAFDSLFVNLPK